MKNLVTKLTTVMQEVKYIQKRGKNNFHGYNYATEADVNEKIREVLAEKGIMMIPNMKNHSVREITTKKGNTEYIVTVDMEFTFVDGESGEQLVFNMTGSGQDPGDKGIFKAISGCQKYALMKFFMIPTGDDPERDDQVPENENTQKPSQKENDLSVAKRSAIKAKLEINKEILDVKKFISFVEEQLQCKFDEMNFSLLEKVAEALEGAIQKKLEKKGA
jgi:hypothetical protein